MQRDFAVSALWTSHFLCFASGSLYCVSSQFFHSHWQETELVTSSWLSIFILNDGTINFQWVLQGSQICNALGLKNKDIFVNGSTLISQLKPSVYNTQFSSEKLLFTQMYFVEVDRRLWDEGLKIIWKPYSMNSNFLRYEALSRIENKWLFRGWMGTNFICCSGW